MTSSGCTKEEIKHILITSHAFSCKSNDYNQALISIFSLLCGVLRGFIFEVGTRCLNIDIINSDNNNNNNTVKYEQIPVGNEATYPIWIVAFQCFI